MLAKLFSVGAEAMILSLVTTCAAKNPRARAVAIFPAPMNPTEGIDIADDWERVQFDDARWRSCF